MMQLDRYDSFVFLGKDFEDRMEYYSFRKSRMLIEEVPFVVGLEIYNPDGEITENGKMKEKKLKRAENKTVRSIEQVAKFLRSDFPKVGNKSIYYDTVLTGKTVFKECLFSTRRMYVHVRGVSDYFESDFVADTVSIISGVCLFGAQTVTLCTEEGETLDLLSPGDRVKLPNKRIESLQIGDNMCFYEYESTCRLTSVVSGLVNDIDKSIFVDIIIDIPHVHYYFFLMDSYVSGCVDNTVMLKWFEAVEKRSTIIYNLYVKCLVAKGLKRKVDIKTIDVFRTVKRYIISLVKENKKPSLNKIVDALNDDDFMWRKLLSVKKITTYNELSFLGYVVAALKVAYAKNDKENHLAVAVENHTEWKIMRATQDLISKLSRINDKDVFNFIGIVPIEKFVVKSDKGGSAPALYLSNVQKSFSDSNGNIIDTWSLLNHLYE